MTNRGYTYRTTIPAGAEGLRPVEYLAVTWTHSTREEWGQRVAGGHVLVDGHPAQAATPLRAGQSIEWRRQPWREPGAPRHFEVRYQDDHLLVVAKPAGLPTLPGAGYLDNTLLSAVRDSWPDAAPVHRLGRWTSGLVVCGRTPEARAALSAVWNTPACSKRYRLLAAGVPTRHRYEIDAPIGPVPYPPLGTLHAASAEGKAAVTRVHVIEQRETSALCDAVLGSGRPHQIRIHLAAIGHPLLGDPLYVTGGTPRSCEESDADPPLPGDPGYALHAAEVRVPHPSTGESLVFKSDPPALLRRRGTREPDSPTSDPFP